MVNANVLTATPFLEAIFQNERREYLLDVSQWSGLHWGNVTEAMYIGYYMSERFHFIITDFP